MKVADVNGLEVLDFKLEIVEKKMNVDVFSKLSNIFTCVLPSNCNPNENIRKIPESISLRLFRVCDSHE